MTQRTTLNLAARGRSLAPFVLVISMLVVVRLPGVARAAEPDLSSLIQSIDLSALDPPSPDPSAIAYVPATGNFIVSDSEVDETAWYRNTNLFEITPHGMVVRTGTTTTPNPKAFSNEPSGAAYDATSGTLLISDDDFDDLSFVMAGTDGTFGTGDDIVSEVDTRFLVGAPEADPEGIAFNAKSGHVFIVDGVGSEVYDWGSGPDRTFRTPDDVHAHWDMALHGALDPEGIAYDDSTGTLLVIDKRGIIFEVDQRGRLVRTLDARASGAVRPSGIEVAPSSIDPSRRSLWIVDRGVDSEIDPMENDGKLFEMTLPRGKPSVSITQPTNGATLSGAAALSATALDAEDGDVSASVQWSSNRDGLIGSGATITAALSTGVHVLKATASDRAGATGSAAVTVTVVGTAQIHVAASTDDAEELRAEGTVDLTDGVLDLTLDEHHLQQIGLRFQVPVPNGARIRHASVQFHAAGESGTPASFMISGQTSDDAPSFTAARGDIGSRDRTISAVSWNPPDWQAAGAAGPPERTPDLSTVVGEIVARPGWASGNALVLIISGFGYRLADAFEAGSAPVLHIEWT